MLIYIAFISVLLIGALVSVRSYVLISNRRSISTTTRLNAGGQVPLVPYYPNKVTIIIIIICIIIISIYYGQNYRDDI
jgi:hypothetical protein